MTKVKSSISDGQDKPALPTIHCDGWSDGEEIPIIYTASRDDNVQPSDKPQPKNQQPVFTFSNIPEGTQAIALVVHDVLDGDPVNGVRPGWTHYTALLTTEGKIIEEGKTSELKSGWVGPYPLDKGEYHSTAYFLREWNPEDEISRMNILKAYEANGLGLANIIGIYTNPRSRSVS